MSLIVRFGYVLPDDLNALAKFVFESISGENGVLLDPEDYAFEEYDHETLGDIVEHYSTKLHDDLVWKWESDDRNLWGYGLNYKHAKSIHIGDEGRTMMIYATSMSLYDQGSDGVSEISEKKLKKLMAWSKQLVREDRMEPTNLTIVAE